jgi:hypothetical protein
MPEKKPVNPEPANDPDAPNPGDPGVPLPTPRISEPRFEDLPRTSQTPLGV